MCRSVDKAGNRKNVRCPSCEQPEKRRTRQNLAYHVKKAQQTAELSNETIKPTRNMTATPKKHRKNAVIPTPEPVTNTATDTVPPEPVVKTPEPETVSVVDETSATIVDNTVVDTPVPVPETVTPENDTTLSENYDNDSPVPQHIVDNRVKIVEKYREQVKNASLEEWTKPFAQYKTSDEVLRLREQEVRSIGAVVSTRAQQIAGMSYDEARTSLQDAERRTDELYEEIRNLRKETSQYDPHNPDHQDKYEEIQTRRAKAHDEFNKASVHVLAEEKRLAQLFSDSHIQALSEVRPMGGDVVMNKGTTTKYVDSCFQKTIDRRMPSDWIEISNKAGGLRLETSAQRAYYVEKRAITEYEEEIIGGHPMEGFEFYTEDEKPHPEDCRYIGWTRDDETGLWTGDHMEVSDYNTPTRVNVMGEIVPKGAGWKKGKVYVMTGLESAELQEAYYRPSKWKRSKLVERATINVGNENAKGSKILKPDEFRTTVVHEFVHHMEANNEKLGAVQNAFYKRRTTNENGATMPLVSYGTSEGEKVREDHFVSPYMGRDYGVDEHDSKHKEVLTTGSEAVLVGAYGGLIGTSRVYTKKDTDMLNFVLGSLSTM